MNVEKRDGRVQPFDFSKIESAVKRVYSSEPLRQEAPSFIIDALRSHFDTLEDTGAPIPIESIQDKIRDILIENNQYKAAESFIIYRKKREEIREQKSDLHKMITKKLGAKDVQNQNANVDEASFGGRMGEVCRVVLKDYALKHCMSKMARNNHINNEIYIHDLDSYALGSHNCLSMPFDELLAKGFKTRQTDVRPPKSVSTASQLVAVLFQLQSLQQFGGVSATHIDWTMVPYIRLSFYKHFMDGIKYIKTDCYDKKYESITEPREVSIEDNVYRCHWDAYNYAKEMTKREVKQAVEGVYHNLNTLQSVAA